MGHKTFSQLVKMSWSRAVSIASNDLAHYRSELLLALNSSNPEERSVAVVALNEGNDADAHDSVISLLDDPDKMVRMEVAEYLEDFGTPKDIEIILDRIEGYQDLRFLLTIALRSITGREAGIIGYEDPPDVVQKEISDWKAYLATHGYLKASRDT